MAHLNQMELSSIRESVSSHKTTSAKLKNYADQCSDPQIKQMFQKAASDADKAAQTLLQML